MIVLAIETSCDDTCVALLKIKNGKLEILSNVVSSQVKLHAKYGGVYPSLAKREHIKNLPLVFSRALRQAQGKPLDLIGVTVGPGLEPCLWPGVNFAKDLAKKLKKPLIPVNHIEGHILINFLNLKSKILNLKSIFPAICLVVSGGHTQLILMREIGKYKLIGETRDDAAGECFDKVARILGLGYPGGPAIAQEASKFDEDRISVSLPRPMIYQKNYDFSFAGLKTAVLYNFKKLPSRVRKSREYIREICFETQQAIIDVLIYKTLKAAKDFRVKTIILGGGVAANEALRKQFQEKIRKEIPNIKYLIPDTKYCTDNAAMVALTAYFHKKETFTFALAFAKATTGKKAPASKVKNWQKIKVNANLKIYESNN